MELILKQKPNFDLSICDIQCHSKLEIITIKQQKQSALAAELCTQLSVNLQHTLSLASKKGASSWLSALPVEELYTKPLLEMPCGYIMVGFPLDYLLWPGFTVDYTMNWDSPLSYLMS